MPVETDGLEKLADWAGELASEGLLTQQELEQIGAHVILSERLRTQSGLDIDLKPFIPYRPATVERRERAGRQVAHPDLTFTGAMLNDLAAKTLDAGVTKDVVVFFRQNAQAEKALHNIELGRDFHGIDDQTMEEIVDAVDNMIQKKLEAR